MVPFYSSKKNVEDYPKGGIFIPHFFFHFEPFPNA